jgi:hypothetical protein
MTLSASPLEGGFLKHWVLTFPSKKGMWPPGETSALLMMPASSWIGVLAASATKNAPGYVNYSATLKSITSSHWFAPSEDIAF